jgi:prepilin-type N-terminal cleavage/methylation domain-containing protein
MTTDRRIMPSALRAETRRRVLRRGFTLIETILVIVIIGLILRTALPSFSRVLRVGRVNRAAQVVSADLDRAFATAARQRKPVRITWVNASMQYTLTDRATGKVLLTQGIGVTNSSFDVLQVTFSVSPLDVFPGGFASSALTVTLTELDYTRHVTMTRAGLSLVGP